MKKNIVIKTVFLAQPYLFSAYRMCRPGASPSSESVCFELLGFDILVDRNLKPWVLEVRNKISFIPEFLPLSIRSIVVQVLVPVNKLILISR